MSSKETVPDLFYEIWDNWRKPQGGGQCAGCPAHWRTRKDLDGTPGDRESSFQHRPSYGYGSYDPDIVILGREPGTPSDDDHSLNRTTESFTDVGPGFVDAPAGTIEYAQPLFDRIADSELAGYFSQVMKCNELTNADSEPARDQCCGLNGHEGYLRDELAVLDPRYVIIFGKQGWKKLRALYNIPRLGPDAFSAELTKGALPSGLRYVAVPNQRFGVFVAPHPDPRGAQYVYNDLDIDVDTRGYYRQLATDILAYHSDSSAH